MNGILDGICTLLLNAVCMINIILMIQIFYGGGLCSRLWHYGVSAVVFILVNTILALLFPAGKAQVLGVYLSIVIIVLCLAKRHKFRAVLYVIPAIMLYVEWSTVLVLFDRILGTDRFIFPLAGNQFTPMTVVTDFLILIVLLLYTRLGKIQNVEMGFSVLEVFVTMALGMLMPMVEPVYLLLDNSSFLYAVGWTFFLLVMNLALLYGLISRRNARYFRQSSQIYKEQYDLEHNHFLGFRERQQDVLKKQHDWKNHMLVLQSMLLQEDYEKANVYFKEMTGDMDIGSQTIKTGNDVADIVISVKKELMKQMDITFRFDGNLAALYYINSLECSIVFSNLLDNAIEANSRFGGERFITMESKEYGELLKVYITNPTKGRLRKEGHRFLTTKRDKAAHGIGLENVKAIIDKYHGEFRIKSEDGVFSVILLFPLRVCDREDAICQDAQIK